MIPRVYLDLRIWRLKPNFHWLNIEDHLYWSLLLITRDHLSVSGCIIIIISTPTSKINNKDCRSLLSSLDLPKVYQLHINIHEIVEVSKHFNSSLFANVYTNIFVANIWIFQGTNSIVLENIFKQWIERGTKVCRGRDSNSWSIA